MKTRLALSIQLPLLSLVLVSTALANTWYADANNGNDNNTCLSASAACRTIGHAITLAASGDSIVLAPGVFYENIAVPFSLNIVGGNAHATIISGRSGSVVTISEEFPVSIVNISGVMITGGSSDSDGGGISNWGQLTIFDSVVADNNALFLAAGSRPTVVPWAPRRFLSIPLTGAGDLNNTDPKLGSGLSDNGGPTQTIPLLSGSPAIDAGNPAGCNDGHGHVLPTDQRGDKRPGDPKLKTGCDMGAYELQFPK